MRRTFLVWLFTFMISAFIGVFIVSFSVLTTQAAKNAKALIQLKISDVIKQIKLNEENLTDIRKELDENALAKVRALAKMILLDPKILTKEGELETIRKLLLVDEIHVSDEKGILIAGTVASFIGYDYASADQSAHFVPAITDANFALAQDPLPRGIDNDLFQYVGVARLDSAGIVQIGYRPERLTQAMKVADIKNLAAGFRVGSSGRVLITDKAGKILSIAEEEYLGKSLQDIGFEPNRFSDVVGGFLAKISGKNYLLEYQRIGEYLIIGQLPAQEMYFSRDSGTTLLILFNVLLFGAIFFLIARLVQVVVINGIYRVNESLARITAGQLDEKVSVHTNKEFVLLSNGINKTVEALKEAIQEAARRIDSELAFAKAIQLSALPSRFPAFPERNDFDIYGEMHTAKKVGGDFYDFFLIDETHLGIVIADVSGKGIPAALFMMISKSLLKTYALSNLSVSEVFYKANNTLCENNDSNMFVTVFMGVLDTHTGKLCYVNAGHNPPLIRRYGHNFDWLPVKNGFVLAGMENTRYTEQEVVFNRGDKLFLYTDGVTEAVNETEQLYSPERLLAFLNSLSVESNLSQILSEVKKDVDNFAQRAEQADDITMLIIEYNNVRRTKEVPQ